MRRLAGLGALVVSMVVLAGCAAGGDTYATEQAGFFSGVWHGWIAPFALLGHLFDDQIRIYETNNDGIWYDVGFYISVISGFGSLSLRRRKPAKKAKSADRSG